MIARASHTSHRKAFGPKRTRSPATKARYVAESIMQHEMFGDTWSLHQYGLDVESEQWQLVLKALGTLRAKQAA